MKFIDKIKRNPYGLTDFEVIKKENYYYVDKTEYIRNIEISSPFLFFIRPRRFGKSLWLAVMECYYDIKRKEGFEEIFKGTKIYSNPTEEKNSYFILRFNFSEVNSNINEVERSFNETIKIQGIDFIKKYSNYIKDAYGKIKKLEKLEKAESILKNIISFMKNKGKIYLLIDEYDNFTNTILSTTGKERYQAVTHGEGFYRHFFNVIKSGTTGPGAPIGKLFITGVSPVTMDDVTSGFNIGDNITTAPGFNEMVGFTERETSDLLDYYYKKGFLKENPHKIIDILKFWYNNYLFSEQAGEKLFNSDMVLYFLKEYIKRNSLPKNMVDLNIKTDYKKLKYLIITDSKGKYRINSNFEKLKTILEEGEISSDIITGFPAHRVAEPDNFISLLYFLGLLTIEKEHRGKYMLKIPNETVRQIYYEYIREAYRDTEIFSIDFFRLGNLFSDMAYEGKWKEVISYITEEMKKQTALRDLIYGEKSIQTFLRAYLNISNYYITKTEKELNRGYADILLLPNLHSFPELPYSYIFEIKYLKSKESSKKELEKKVEEGKRELSKYEKDLSLKKITGGSKLIKIILLFAGVELKLTVEA